MAGTVVTTEEGEFGGTQKVKFAWTSSAGGAADATTSNAYSGAVERVLIVPGATTPSDLFDVVITDGDSVDILLAFGANCSNAHTTVITADNLSAVHNDNLTLAITNAGDSKNGNVIVYMR